MARCNHLCWLRGEAQARTRTIKDDKLTLEEDVSIDGKANPSVGLHATKAFWAACWGKIDVFAGDNCKVGANAEGKVREGSRAGEGVAALGGVTNVLALNFCTLPNIQKMTYNEAPETWL